MECDPSERVNILHYHGTADEVAPYPGGSAIGQGINTPPLAGVLRNIQMWAGYNGCSDPVTEAAPSLDSTSDVPGLDTVVTRYMTCPPGGAVELWTINGAAHKPALTAEFSPRLIDWLLARPKP